jgi:lysozyme family protein
MTPYRPPTDTEIIDMILQHEGPKYTNHPDDSGGPTKWGITMPILAKHLGRAVTARDIQMLTREIAAAAYRTQFVTPFVKLPDPIRVNVIDMGVNAGQRRAIILLQQTIGATPDGRLGPQTYGLTAKRDWNVVYVGVRLAFYEDLIVAYPKNATWRPGWRNRALSFLGGLPLGARRLEGPRRSNQPLYGYMGKAYRDAA